MELAMIKLDLFGALLAMLAHNFCLRWTICVQDLLPLNQGNCIKGGRKMRLIFFCETCLSITNSSR